MVYIGGYTVDIPCPFTVKCLYEVLKDGITYQSRTDYTVLKVDERDGQYFYSIDTGSGGQREFTQSEFNNHFVVVQRAVCTKALSIGPTHFHQDISYDAVFPTVGGNVVQIFSGTNDPATLTRKEFSDHFRLSETVAS